MNTMTELSYEKLETFTVCKYSLGIRCLSNSTIALVSSMCTAEWQRVSALAHSICVVATDSACAMRETDVLLRSITTIPAIGKKSGINR